MKKPTVSMIVAVDMNWAIGKDNTLPFNVPEDMSHFVRTTKGHAVIMGRKTFESLRNPLPNRTNIVLSRRKWECTDGIRVVDNIEDAIKLGLSLHEKVFVIGGGEVYKEALPHVDQIYLTRIGTMIRGADTHFTDITCSGDWVVGEYLTHDEEFGSTWLHSRNGGTPYFITRYVRKSKD